MSLIVGWPQSQDYNEAIQNPQISFGDPELRGGQAVTNAMGIPMPRSGNFADVYELIGASGQKWAIKCFTRQIPGLQERYGEISKSLAQAKLPFMVDFDYLARGVRIRGEFFPVLKMQWVEGFLLNEFVRDNLDKPAHLEKLGQIWKRMAIRLREARIAHADLQHGNVILVPGSKAASLSVRLIDYDGMWVPALASKKSGEVGHANYQHPQRLRSGIYSSEVDRFPHLVIHTALRSLIVGGPDLWKKYDNGDNLLFRQADLDSPSQSPLFRELAALNDSDVKKLVQTLAQAVQQPLEQTPLLEDLASSKQATAVATQKPPTVDSVFTSAKGGGGSRRPPRRGVPGWVWLAGGAAAVVVAAVVVLVASNGSRPKTPDGPPVAAKGPGGDDRPKDADKVDEPKLDEDAREVQAAKKAAADLAKKAEEDKLRAKDLLEKADEKAQALHKKIEDTVKAAVANLKDKNPAIRIKTANALAKLPSTPETKAAAEPLVEAMMDPVQEVRIAASEALAKIAPSIQPHVLTLLIGNDKYAAARELPGLGKEAKFALPALIHCYQTNASIDVSTTAQNFKTRGVWLDSLAGIAPDDKRVVQIILDEVAKDKYQGIEKGASFYIARQKAISLLDVVQADKKEKVKALVPVLDANAYPQLTMTAIVAIERIGAPEAAEAIPALKKLKLSTDDAIRQAAASAVAKIEASK